jgi:hypothetical protein
MYTSARARPHDGSNSHRDGASLLHRGADGCTTVVSSFLVVAHRIMCQFDIVLSSFSPVFVSLQSGSSVKQLILTTIERRAR